MSAEIFVAGAGFFFLILLIWSFRTLPEEKWQIMATVPVCKLGTRKWRGLNLTFYGAFISLATSVAVTTLIVLTSAISIPVEITLLVATLTMAIGFGAAKIVAALVEKKRHTFTVSGASFAGILATPMIFAAVSHFLCESTNKNLAIPFIAAMAISYSLGEGLGRLACISFGCCYGKRLSDCPGFVQRLFDRCAFVFNGELKKISYENRLDGQKVVPIQAMTSCVYVVTGLIATLLFLNNLYWVSLALVTAVTQVWRILSETLRADYRGPGNITVYQYMSLACVGFVLAIIVALEASPAPLANIDAGLSSLWDPSVILFIQFVGLASFVYTGRSMVTGSTISFHVVIDKI